MTYILSQILADDAVLSYFIYSMKIKQTMIVLALMVGGNFFFLSPVVGAECGGVQTSVINCDQNGKGDATQSGIWGILITTINIMSAGIGVTAVGGVVYGSIMYASGEGNAEKTKKARMIIFNVLIGLLMYAVMYAFLNYMIPGGMFNATK